MAFTLPAQVDAIASSPRALAIWLIVVASLRALSVVLGYAAPHQLHSKVFARDFASSSSPSSSSSSSPAQGKAGVPPAYTALGGRTFAVWTAVTCLVCLAGAARPTDAPTMHLAVATFVIADLFFTLELFVYKTVTLASIAAPFFFANTSIAWITYMLYATHGPQLGLEWTHGALANLMGTASGEL